MSSETHVMKTQADHLETVEANEIARLFGQATLGDSEAGRQLYTRCIPALRGWLVRRIPYARVQDVAHDALAAAFRMSARFRPDAAFMPWLKTIALRLALNNLRNDSRRRRRERAFADALELSSSEQGDSPLPYKEALKTYVSALPEAQARLLQQRYFEGQTCSTIAFALGRSRTVVAVRIHRICRRLRNQMQLNLRTQNQTSFQQSRHPTR